METGIDSLFAFLLKAHPGSFSPGASEISMGVFCSVGFL